MIAQSRANVAKAQSQGETLTQAQSLGREIDKLRTKNTQQAEQNRTAPQGISDKALSDGIQGLNAAVKSIDPNMSFSYNDLAEAARNILSGNGKTGAVQDYISSQNSNQANGSLEQWGSQQSMVGEGVQVAGGKRYVTTGPGGVIHDTLEWGADKLINGYKNITDPEKTNMTAGQALGAPAAVIGLGVLAGAPPGTFGKSGDLLAVPAKIAKEKVIRDYLNSQFAKPKKNK